MKETNKHRIRNNIRRAKHCNGCYYLHIGVNVDHNHCDNPHGGDDNRASGIGYDIKQDPPGHFQQGIFSECDAKMDYIPFLFEVLK